MKQNLNSVPCLLELGYPSSAYPAAGHGMQLCWFPELTLYGAIAPERAARGTMKWATDATTTAFRESQRSRVMQTGVSTWIIIISDAPLVRSIGQETVPCIWVIGLSFNHFKPSAKDSSKLSWITECHLHSAEETFDLLCYPQFDFIIVSLWALLGDSFSAPNSV